MSVIDFPVPPPWLIRYYARGFRLIFYPTKQKGPSGLEAAGWQTRSDLITDWREGRNVGIFSGHEVSPGKFLADIDFDWTDGIALAKHILPNTGFAFGRATRPISHALYTTPEPIPSTKFKNIDGKDFVELRGTDKDGSGGHQTMAPPSIHENGEEVVLRADEEITHVDNLLHLVMLYSVACIIYSQLGHRGLLHDTRLAVAGFLLGEGLTPEEVIKVGQAIAAVSGNDVDDVKTVVRSTASRLKAGEHVFGKTALMKAIGDDGKAVIARIKEWLGGSDFLEDSKGKILANHQENVKRGLEKIGISLSFDMFAQKPLVEYSNPSLNGNSYKGPLVDSIVSQAWLEIDEKYHFRAARDFFNTVVDNIAFKNKFHPVLDYLQSLKWDEVPRVDEWLIRSGGAADTEYVRAVSAIMLLAAVRRVRDPGCKYDEMVVLESSTQGLLKSTALRTLCPNDKWFSDDLPLNVDAKQIVERTLGKWIIEASDLAGMRPAAVEHLKGMLSRQTDGPVRMAYGRLPVEQKRQFIIAGTTNSYTYLSDSTGNRRFWPIRVTGFDVSWIFANRDQLWAEAAAREAKGESIRLDPALYEHAAMQQDRRRVEDPWELVLDEKFPRNEKHRLTMPDIWGALGLSVDRQDSNSSKRIYAVMEVLGFEKNKAIYRDGKVVKGFRRDIELGQDELPQEESE